MRSNLNIAIDTDGVLIEFWSDIVARAIRYFRKVDTSIIIDGYNIDDILKLDQSKRKEYLIKYIEQYNLHKNDKINIEEYEIKNIFNCSDISRQMFWISNMYDYCMNSEFMDNAVATIKKWCSEGKKVYNITAREFVTKYGFLGDLFRRILNERYKKEGIEFEGVYYCSEKEKQNAKYIVCNALQIDIIIDDFSKNIEQINEKTNASTLCYDTPHNKKFSSPSTTRINNFPDADKFVQQYELMRTSILGNQYFLDGQFKILTDAEERKLSKIELLEYYKQRKIYYRNMDNKKSIDLSYSINKKAYGMKLTNKNSLPYPNNIGEIFAVNEDNTEKSLEMASSIKNRNIYLGNKNSSRKEDKQETLEALISIVANGNSILINYESAAIIAKITGAPIIPLINNNSKIVVGDVIIVLPGEDLGYKQGILNDIFIAKNSVIKKK